MSESKSPETIKPETFAKIKSDLEDKLKKNQQYNTLLTLVSPSSKTNRSSSFSANHRSPGEKSANPTLNNRFSYSKSPVKMRPPIPPKPKITMTKSTPSEGSTLKNTRPGKLKVLCIRT